MRTRKPTWWQYCRRFGILRVAFYSTELTKGRLERLRQIIEYKKKCADLRGVRILNEPPGEKAIRELRDIYIYGKRMNRFIVIWKSFEAMRI